MDNLQDLASQPLFSFAFDWSTQPKTTSTMLRRWFFYPGTAQKLYSLNPIGAINVNGSLTFFTHAELNLFLDFMRARRGRVERFWIRHPKQTFTLKTTAGTGTLVLVCQRNDFQLPWQGYERVYITMNNGDTITQKITGVYDNILGDQLEITLQHPLDRDVFVDTLFTTRNYNSIGRLLLVRFESDEFEIKSITEGISQVDIQVVELIKDYGDL
jgi:hypothetical protein